MERLVRHQYSWRELETRICALLILLVHETCATRRDLLHMESSVTFSIQNYLIVTREVELQFGPKQND